MAYRTYHWHSSLDTVETAAGIADLVTVTTESLAEILRKHNPEVAVIPNMISEALLSWPRPKPVTHGRRRRVTIGWRGGASHALDVQVIAPAVRKVLKGCPWARLLVVGTDFRPSFECPADFTNWVPVSANLRYYRSIQPFDINLAPLSGQQFDISKSDISALETAALGIPTIAADMEPYREFVIDGKTGYLVSRRADWAKRIRELVCDDAAREEMGRAAREQARARTIESGYTRWVDAYEGLGR
jgi:glycosyltransferase involved in cell wall biosynthesis